MSEQFDENLNEEEVSNFNTTKQQALQTRRKIEDILEKIRLKKMLDGQL